MRVPSSDERLGRRDEELLGQIVPEILVVEDSATQATQVRELFEQAGYRVRIAGSASDALAQMEQSLPNVIVSDVLMPGMDGFELCRALNARPRLREIPVILLTTLSEPADVVRGLECGADGFVIKPYDPAALLDHVQNALVHRRRRGDEPGDQVNFHFRGAHYSLDTDRLQLLEILLATYEKAVEQKKELETKNLQLEQALLQIRRLESVLRICSFCKRIQDESGQWAPVDHYISEHTDTAFSHGMCPECFRKRYSD